MEIEYGNKELRKRFEDWYVTNCFDLENNPIGSKQCDLQWRAWAASKGYNSRGYPGTESGPHPRPTGENAMSPGNPKAPWNRRAEPVGLRELVEKWETEAQECDGATDAHVARRLAKRVCAIELKAALANTEPSVPVSQWQPIETAPKDGKPIFVLSKADSYEDGDGNIHERPARAYIAKWNPDGDSWVDEVGNPDGEICTLGITGTWDSGMGWFQPNEVTHWMPLPEPPQP